MGWANAHLAQTASWGGEATGEIVVAEVTTNDYHDSEVLASLLDGISDEILQVSGDGAYDTFGSHDAIARRGLPQL